MYWEGDYDRIRKCLKERRPTAKKKEHTCCEGHKIAVGEEYVYIAAIWDNPINYQGYYFKALKLCLGCKEDWDTILRIFHDYGEDDACIVYGKLKEAVRDALENDFIQADHPLIKKWYRDAYRAWLRENMEPEEIVWKEIEDSAVRNGLQPVLPGL